MEDTYTETQPQWRRWIGAGAAIAMGALWLLAGIWKLTIISKWQLMMTQILVPVPLSLAATMAVIIGDLTAGVLLLRPSWRRLGGLFSTGLLAIFTAYFAINYAALKGADCTCFPWVERTVGPAFFWSESGMIALSLAAAWFAPPMRKLGTAAKTVAAIAAVAFVALAIDKAGPQPDADVPASIQTDGGEFSLHQGKVFVFFFNPLCPHCEDAATRMGQLTWKAAFVGVPTQDPQFGPGFMEDTGVKDAKLSPDLDLLKERFPFEDVPYGVAISEGHVVERFVFFEDPDLTEHLRKLDFVE
jgi:uncharacterized membrane protein YphA (DoxX/SURF4 family)